CPLRGTGSPEERSETVKRCGHEGILSAAASKESQVTTCIGPYRETDIENQKKRLRLYGIGAASFEVHLK
ncbi:MAG: hypothetical protein J6Q17_01645, partial [Clostridia bacterium]|nr:hypothetical protein [Clostridia bacterium]